MKRNKRFDNSWTFIATETLYHYREHPTLCLLESSLLKLNKELITNGTAEQKLIQEFSKNFFHIKLILEKKMKSQSP